MTNKYFLQNKANEFVKSVLQNTTLNEIMHEFTFLGYSVLFKGDYFVNHFGNGITFLVKVSNKNVYLSFNRENVLNNSKLPREIANQMQKSAIEAILSISHEND